MSNSSSRFSSSCAPKHSSCLFQIVRKYDLFFFSYFPKNFLVGHMFRRWYFQLSSIGVHLRWRKSFVFASVRLKTLLRSYFLLFFEFKIHSFSMRFSTFQNTLNNYPCKWHLHIPQDFVSCQQSVIFRGFNILKSWPLFDFPFSVQNTRIISHFYFFCPFPIFLFFSLSHTNTPKCTLTPLTHVNI